MAVIIFNSPCRVMTKDNIALAALLQTKEACWEGGVPPDHKVRRSFEEKNLKLLFCLILITKDVAQPILVCSAHIHWDPEFCDVKLIQSMMLMEQLRQIMENFGHSFRPGHKKAGPESVQLLLCADFNSLPESGVIEFIKNGRVPINHPDLKVRISNRNHNIILHTAGHWVCRVPDENAQPQQQ